jgi:hypothetical protein
MTPTAKPVRRVTVDEYGVLFPFDRKKRRRVVVQVGPGDVVRFRELGRRQWFDLHVEHAFGLAVKGAAGFRVCMLPPPRKLSARSGCSSG